MKSFKEFGIPTITLCVICLVAAFLLGLTNKVTAPKIEQLAVEAQQEAMKSVLPDADSFGDSKTDEKSGCTYAEAKDASGKVIGYAVTASGKGGYNGEIGLMVGIDANGAVKEISFLSINETPSIGMKLKTNNSFLSQLKGLTGSAALTKNGGTVDAVTGATKTSTGITDAVNNALMCYNSIKGEGSENG